MGKNAPASISGNVINSLTVARGARAILVGLVAYWGAGPFLPSILLEDALFVAQAITDFRITKYAVECYVKRVVHPKAYAL